jgi:hypothetical protein
MVGFGSLVSPGPGGRKKVWVLLGAAAAVAVVTGLVLWACDGSGGIKSSDPQERAAAIGQSPPPKTESAVQEMRQHVSDPDIRVSLSAVRKLGEAKTEESRKALAEVIRSPALGRIRGEAAAVLGKDKKADPALLTRTLLEDKDPDARAGAALGLRRLGDRSAIPQLFRGLSDPDEKVRLQSVSGISDIVGSGIRFDYNARESPESQRDRIQFIRKLLQERGLL